MVHYQRPAGGYDDWGLYAWGDIDPAYVTEWPKGQPFAGRGLLRPVRLGEAQAGRDVASASWWSTRRQQGRRPGPHASTSPQTGEVWLKQGDPAIYPSRQAATGEPDPPVDEGTAVLHYRRADGNYDGWGLHLWDGAANPTEWSAPLRPTRTDAFGAVFRVPLAAGATGLNYIIHQGDTKDLPDDQRLDFASAGREVWLLAGHAGPAAAVHGRPAASADIDITQAEGALDRPVHRRLADRRRPTARRTRWSPRPAGGVSVVDGELTGDVHHAAVAGAAQRAHRGPAREVPAPVGVP